MANLFFAKNKAPKQQAINALVLEISNYFGGRYEVFAGSDDGGSLLEVQVEVPTGALDLASQVPDFPFFDIWPIWMGWRVVVTKVPPDYIDFITLAPEADY